MKLISVAGIILLTHYGICQNVDGDYIVVENDVEDDYEESGSGSGDGDDFCELGSGDEEEDLSGIAETVPYSMASSNNLDIELSLLHMVDDSVKIDCDVKKIYQEVSSSDAFPANLYLIKDVAVCNDLATAVGNDITADVVDLGIVSGTGHVTATLPITWGDVKSSNCLAMLKPKSSEDDVIAEFRRLRPKTGCRRSSVFTAAPGARIFTSLNLAAFGLVASGAAAVAAAAAANSVAVNNPGVAGGDANAQFFNTLFTIAPFAAVLAMYSFYAASLARRRRRNDFRRKYSKYPEYEDSFLGRIDEFQDNFSIIEPIKNFGETYMKNIMDGPWGVLFNAFSAVRRNYNRRQDQQSKYFHKKKSYNKYY